MNIQKIILKLAFVLFIVGMFLPSTSFAQLESYFVPITPCRLVDTRNVGGVFGGETTRDFWAFGDLATNQGGSNSCGIPETASALHINFTAVSPTGFGYLRAWPYGEVEPGATLMAFTGVSISNATALAICYQCISEFNVKIYGAVTHLVVDAVGYYQPIAPPP